MNIQKQLILVLVVLFISCKVKAQVAAVNETIGWLIDQNSSLRINGSTNINKFSCDVPGLDKTDTLFIAKSKTNRGYDLEGNIELMVNSFDCHNQMMTKGLRKTLQATTYPRLLIRFITLDELPALTGTPANVTGTVEIEIAGVKKVFMIQYQLSRDAEKVIHLAGTRDIDFSDFKLIPPKKLGGLVKTQDQLTVEFNLNMRTIELIKNKNITKL